MLTDFSALRHQVRALVRRGSAGFPPELRGRLIAASQELRAARYLLNVDAAHASW